MRSTSTSPRRANNSWICNPVVPSCPSTKTLTPIQVFLGLHEATGQRISSNRASHFLAARAMSDNGWHGDQETEGPGHGARSASGPQGLRGGVSRLSESQQPAARTTPTWTLPAAHADGRRLLGGARAEHHEPRLDAA